jgi:DNA-directed RNA polymerase subunit RPC12/RpoP
MPSRRPPDERVRDSRRDGRTRRHRRPGADSARDARGPASASDVPFTCGHCGRRVGPLPSGGRNRNHCPYCLYSRHVDAERSGDRASMCQGIMEPIGVFERPNGEEVITHRCLVCGFERFNRVGADDDEAVVAALPRIAPRSASRQE